MPSQTARTRYIRERLVRDGWLIEALRPKYSRPICPIHKVKVDREPAPNRFRGHAAHLDTCPICFEKGATACLEYSEEFDELKKIPVQQRRGRYRNLRRSA